MYKDPKIGYNPPPDRPMTPPRPAVSPRQWTRQQTKEELVRSFEALRDYIKVYVREHVAVEIATHYNADHSNWDGTERVDQKIIDAAWEKVIEALNKS